MQTVLFAEWKQHVAVTRSRLLYAGARAHRSLPAFSPRAAIRTPPMAFVTGCGRSGTTVLGSLLSAIPGVTYLFEPFYLWAAVDDRTDVAGIYAPNADAHCLLRAEDVASSVSDNFTRVFMPRAGRSSRLLLEKTPMNCMRLAYIDKLVPTARYIHILRHGVDVAESIGRMASRRQLRYGSQLYNSWWGLNDRKWEILARDAIAQGYFPTTVRAIKDHVARGACEWVMSLEEVRRSQPKLQGRFLELRYESLVGTPEDELRRLVGFLALPASDDWIANAASTLQPRGTADKTIRLPEAVAGPFKGWIEKLGYNATIVIT